VQEHVLQQAPGAAVQLTPVSADVLIIRGAPGTGKSQAAKALTSFFPRGAKVEVDILRKMVISVDWKNQKEHINLLQVAARLTHDFTNLGFRPVLVVDTFSGDKVNRFIDTLRQLDGSLAIRIVGLHVSDDALRARLEARPLDGFKDFGICKKLNEDVLTIKHPCEFQIDTTELLPRQTAEEIYRRLLD
jgi:chloramphenicol 3-O-phosphotransferase